MPLKKSVVINSSLAILIIAAGIGAYFVLNPPTSSTAAGTQLTTTVQQGEVSSTITASGSVAPLGETTTSFAVSGTIATVNVALGQTVTAGAVLGTLQTSTLQQTLNDAYTQLSQARTQLAGARTGIPLVSWRYR